MAACRIYFRSTVFAALVFAAVLPARAGESYAHQPNILFILCDDLGYGDVGVFYQNQRATRKDRNIPYFETPGIDTLARDGVQLTQHYAAAPVCAPSRGSLLTGRTQGRANIRDNQFDKALADTHTLGSVLREAGYATAAFGKWGLQGRLPDGTEGKGNEKGSLDQWPAYPTKRGFDFYFGYVRHKDGHFHYPKEDGREVWENDRECSSGMDLCYTTDLFTARAKKWIADQTASRPGQPFFAYLAFDTPHAKLQNPPCAYPAGGGLKGGVQWLGKPHAMINTAAGTKDGYMFPDYANATWDHDANPATPEVPWPDVQKRYANDVRRIDFAVGDILQLLQDLGIQDNTLVVFSSDNGPSEESYLPEKYTPEFFRGYGPFDGIKRDTWEGGLREPTLVRWPARIPAGRVNAQPSGQWDWLATFCDVAGVAKPAASDGVSLVPSLTGSGTQRPGTIYIEYFNNGRTPGFNDFDVSHRNRTRGQMQIIYLNGYKGIRYNVISADDNFEIYNLAKDPQETRDLGKSPEMAGLQSAMKARVLQVRTPDPDAQRPYDTACVPALPHTPAPADGAAYTRSTYLGEWSWMPDFGTLTPVDRHTVDDIDVSKVRLDQPFGLSFEGWFRAERDGEYMFTLASDTGAMLFLHDILVIDEPRENPAGLFSGSVRLQAGWHPLRLYYRHAGGTNPRLELTCNPGNL